MSDLELMHGFNKLLGFRLVEWREDLARIEFGVEDHHLNRAGILHGGVLATLLDATLGFSGAYTGEPGKHRRGVTLSLDVSYLGQARSGLISCVGERRGGGKTIYMANGTVTGPDGAILATGQGVFRYTGDAAKDPVSFFESVHGYVQDYGYLAVSLGILLEDFGLPAPGETLLISGAVAAAHGTLSIRLLLPLAWIAAVIGDNIGFAIGDFAGHRLVAHHGSRVGVTSARLEKVEALFDKYGDAVIVFARFVVLARQLNGIVAGTLEMHWLRFTVLNAIGAALWVGFWGMLAYWLGRSIFQYLREIRHYEPILIAVAVVAALAAGAFVLVRRHRRNKSPRRPPT